MNPWEYRWTVQYAERSKGDTGSWVVFKQGEPRRQCGTKSAAIREAQLLNGWEADGKEATYAEQTTRADKRRQRRA